MVIDK